MTSFDASLRAADLILDTWLGEGDLAATLRTAYDPGFGTTDRPARLEAAGPVAVDECWDHLRHDTAYSAVLWVKEWPQTAAPPFFLHALIFQPRRAGLSPFVPAWARPGATVAQPGLVLLGQVPPDTPGQQPHQTLGLGLLGPDQPQQLRPVQQMPRRCPCSVPHNHPRESARPHRGWLDVSWERCHWDSHRSGEKNVCRSATTSAGASMVGKCSAWSNSVQ